MSKLTRGIYPDIPKETYHSDPCEPFSINSSTLWHMITRSPAHFWQHFSHNPKSTERQVTTTQQNRFDIGTAAHSIVLEGIDKVVPLDFNDFRTNNAKNMAKSVREDNKIPILRKEYQKVLAMADNFPGEQLRRQYPGKPEVTVVFELTEKMLGRLRVDWLPDDLDKNSIIFDFKTSETAEPEIWCKRNLWDRSIYQAVFYTEGMKKLTGKHLDFVFIVQETSPPYSWISVAIHPDAYEIALDRVKYAVQKIVNCLREDTWPAYSNNIAMRYEALPPRWWLDSSF